MARTSTYLNFAGRTEEAFTFYKSVFGTDYVYGPIRFGDLPVEEGQPGSSDDEKRLVLNVQLPILGGHLLQGNDVEASQLTQGNSSYICLHPDSRAEADALFAALSAGGSVGEPLREQFWGDYFGTLVDRVGVRWMINQSNAS